MKPIFFTYIESSTGLYNEVGLEQSRPWPAETLCITIAANIADSGLLAFDACFPDSVVGFVPVAPIPERIPHLGSSSEQSGLPA